MNILEKTQQANIQRRVNVLAGTIAKLLPPSTTILDVGCGDGLIDKLILSQRPGITITGCDVLIRNFTHIPVLELNGNELPFENKSFDLTMFVDILHHTASPSSLLDEAKRVSRRGIIIKDHIMNRIFAEKLLRIMDQAGNARYSVNLPYNYWAQSKWMGEFKRMNLNLEAWITDVPIYPWWTSWLFGSGLHFVAYLNKTNKGTGKK